MINHIRYADIISLLNASLGIGALLLLLENQVLYAFSLLLLSILADGLDGIVARRTGKGPLGSYLEAMADMLSLSIVPLFFIYHLYRGLFTGITLVFLLFLVLLFFFFLCSMIRLSSFHILTTDQHFVGLPASASTLLLLILALFSVDLWVLFLILFLLALALISPMKFPKPGRYINSAAAVLFLLSAYLISINTNLILFLLLIAVLFYITAGPLLNFLKKEKKKNN